MALLTTGILGAIGVYNVGEVDHYRGDRAIRAPSPKGLDRSGARRVRELHCRRSRSRRCDPRDRRRPEDTMEHGRGRQTWWCESGLLYHDAGRPLYLLMVYAKARKDDLSGDEKRTVRNLAAVLKGRAH